MCTAHRDSQRNAFTLAAHNLLSELFWQPSNSMQVLALSFGLLQAIQPRISCVWGCFKRNLYQIQQEVGACLVVCSA